MNDKKDEIVRPKDVKKHSSFSHCKWAAGEWEGRFYAWTPTHRDQCEFTIDQMINNPAWFKTKAPKVDKQSAARNNKSKGDEKNQKRRNTQ